MSCGVAMAGGPLTLALSPADRGEGTGSASEARSGVAAVPPTEGVHVAPAPGDVEQLDAPQRLRNRRIDDQVLAVGVEASSVRRTSSGAPVAQACGLQAVGYSTG